MENTENIGDLEEKINHEPLSRLVEELGCRVRYSEVPSFIMGYCASDDETFEKVSEYIQQQIGISPNSVRSVSLDSRSNCLLIYLSEHLDELSCLEGEVVMIKAKGFERLAGLKTPTDPLEGTAYRTAHDYDQDVVQDLVKEFQGVAKKVLIVTQIGRSLGDRLYNVGVRSACNSQFKSFLYELGK